MSNKTSYNGICRGRVSAMDSSEAVKPGKIEVEVYPMWVGSF
jgi:hypothetical protein